MASIVNCKKAKEELLERDWDSTVRRARSHSSLLQVSDKLVVNEWHGVWDEALNQELNFTKSLTRPLLDDNLCNLCSASITETTYAEHLCAVHTFPLARIVSAISETKSDLFSDPSLSCINC